MDLLASKQRTYSSDKIKVIQGFYIGAALLWSLIIILLKLYQTGILGWIILIIPYLVFFIGFSHIPAISVEVEEDMFKINYLSLGLIIVLPLLAWINKDYRGDKSRFILIVVVAMILNLLSLLDIWVSREWLSVAKHAKSSLQTMAIVLLSYVLYMYYLGSISTNSMDYVGPEMTMIS